MRNCEQLLGSLGSFAHSIGSLDELTKHCLTMGLEAARVSHVLQLKKNLDSKQQLKGTT